MDTQNGNASLSSSDEEDINFMPHINGDDSSDEEGNQTSFDKRDKKFSPTIPIINHLSITLCPFTGHMSILQTVLIYCLCYS